MKIYVDADATPKGVKEILYRVAERTGVEMIFVANSYLNLPRLLNLKMIQVEAGFDVADARIVALCATGDLVVTADIPLAAQAIEKGAVALNPRGELYTSDNIGPILARRNFMDTLRGGLVEDVGGGPAAFSAKDREKFANQLDKFITKSKNLS